MEEIAGVDKEEFEDDYQPGQWIDSDPAQFDLDIIKKLEEHRHPSALSDKELEYLNE